MRNFLPFIVVGLATGSIYSIAALGLVLTYKTSGIFNFAHGAIAAAAAYGFYELHYQHGLAWPLAGFLCVVVLAPAAGVLCERIVRGLADLPPEAKVVATVGLLLAIQGTLSAIYGVVPITFPQFLPTQSYRVFGTTVGADQIIAMAIAAVAAAGLYVFFRFSRAGVTMRGVVDNPELLDLAGTSPTRVRRQAWMIGVAFAALSGILLAPLLNLEAGLLTLLVVQAFGAAAVGRFSSLPLAYLGGLVVGVGAALSAKYVPNFPSLAGFPAAWPFLVLFFILLLTPKRRFVETGRKRLVAEDRRLSPVSVWVGRLALIGALVAVPQVVGARLPVFINGLIFILIFLSLHLLVRTSGQVSLCHAAFAAIGAASFSHLTDGAGLPWVIALIGAGLITVPVGALVAIPAIRLSGLYLALATFGFGLLVERMLFGTTLMFGTTGRRLVVPRPHLGDLPLSSDRGFYYVCLVIVLLACVAIYLLNHSRLGRLLRAMADSPVAMITHGTSVNVTRVLVFCISAFLAGVAGALFGALFGTISGFSFIAFNSLIWLTVLAIAGSGEFSAPVIAAALLAVVPSYVDNPNYTDWQPVLFGGIAVVAALAQGGRFRLTIRLRRAAERHVDRVRHSPAAERWALARNGAGSPRGAVVAAEAVREV